MIEIIDPVQNDIIASGPWVREDGSLDRRIVLRKPSTMGYVVHLQCREEDKSCHFAAGDYFSTSPDGDKALSEAFACFVHRVGSMLGTKDKDLCRHIGSFAMVSVMRKRALASKRRD
jgi:hypothetical protein